MKLIAFTALLLCAIMVAAQTETKHPIDVELQNCLNPDSNQTTFSRVECESIATELWDLELNKYYNELMKKLSKTEQDALKESQRKWIDYRDKELHFSGVFYVSLQGTMWRNVAAGRRCDITRTRALELKEYLDALPMD